MSLKNCPSCDGAERAVFIRFDSGPAQSKRIEWANGVIVS